MQKIANSANVRDVLGRSIRVLETGFKSIEAFLHKVSQVIMRGIGLIFCAGGLLATIGWLLAATNTNPLSTLWSVAVWLVVVGVLLLALGMQALAFQYVLRLGMIGQYGLLIFLLGALILAAGAYAIDLFVLPWMFKLAGQIPELSGQLQGAYNSVQSGTNTAANAVTSTGSSACSSAGSGVSSLGGIGGNIGNTISNGCGSSAGASNPVPSQTVPSLTLDGLLASIGLPTMAALGGLGLIFLSGAPLAPGCLVMGVIFLVAGVRPRSSLLLVIASALLNLGGQFVLHVGFLGPFLGVLLFLSLAWFGFTLWSPWKFNLLGRLLSTEKQVTAEKQ